MDAQQRDTIAENEGQQRQQESVWNNLGVDMTDKEFKKNFEELFDSKKRSRSRGRK